MRQTARSIKSFVGGFDLPAYPNNAIPDDVQLPYLTYPLVEPEWNQKASFYIQGWYRTTDNTAMLEKADQILREIGTGLIISTEDGYIVIYPETPLLQVYDNNDDGTKSFYINLSLNSYHNPGL